MEKVLMWAVIKKTSLLVSGRKTIMAKYLAAAAVLGLFQFVDPGPADPANLEFSPLLFFGLLAYALVGMALAFSFMHFVVGSCRNRTSFFPPKPGSVFLKYLLATMGLSGITFISFALCSLPMGAIILSGVLDNPQEITLGLVLMVPAVLLAFLGGIVPMVRFSFVLPAAAIGDKYSFARCWAMTKGHSVRMVFTVLLMSLPIFGIGFFMGLFLDEGETAPKAANVLLILVNGLWWVWTYTFFSILYEDLNNRYEAMAAGGASAPEKMEG